MAEAVAIIVSSPQFASVDSQTLCCVEANSKMLLSPNDVQEIGLDIMNVRRGKKKEKALLLEFHKHFGSSPLDIADCWYDL